MSSSCFGCGAENPVGLGLQFERDAETVVAAFAPSMHHQGAPGFLHGGVAATALDETMGAVGWVLDGTHWVTATLALKYRRPVPLDGSTLRIEAWRDEAAGSTRRRRCHGRLLLATGEVAVEADGVFVAAPASMRIEREGAGS